MKASPWLWSALVHFGILGAGAGLVAAVWHEPPVPSTHVFLEVQKPKPPRFTPQEPLPTSVPPRVLKTVSPLKSPQSPVPLSAANPAVPESAAVLVVDVPPQLDHLVKPRYPSRLRHLGVTGSVMVDCKISAQGRCLEALVVESSGHQEMDDRAVEALRQAHFQPRRVNGQPQEGQATITVQFALE